MKQHRPIQLAFSSRNLGLALVVVLDWGLNFVAIKLALH